MFNRDDNLLLSAGVGPSLRPLIAHTYRTGSHYTVSPPVTNTDIDFYAYANPLTTPPGGTRAPTYTLSGPSEDWIKLW